MTFKFGIREHIKKAWPTYKANFGLFLLLVMITGLLQLISSTRHAHIGLGLFVGVCTILLSYVWIRSVLRLIDGHPFQPFTKEMLPTLPQFWGFIKINLLSGFFILLGCLLLIIPGLYISGRLIFAQYMYIDHNDGARKTLREAWNMTRGHGWQLFWKYIVISIFIFIGLIALGVGIFITYPLGMMTIAMMYREFKKFAKSHQEVPTPHIPEHKHTHVEKVEAEKVEESK